MQHLTSILTQNDTLAYLSLTYRLHYGYKDTPGRFQTQKDLADLFEAYSEDCKFAFLADLLTVRLFQLAERGSTQRPAERKTV